ncbi:MAG: Gfo/Idh/MocA family oxidoreductase [Acidobacteriota bacterium]
MYSTWTVALFLLVASFPAPEPGRRVGIIGLDTSHATAFTKILNNPEAGDRFGGYRVTAAFPEGSRDIESSVSRIPRYTAEMQEMGVEIVGSIAELLARVDVVLLETNDGRRHLEQAMPVFAARKPVFIDKPLGGTLAEAAAILEAARRAGSPVFSSSPLRYYQGWAGATSGAGSIHNAFAWSPAHLEATHPDLFWYGIHAVEQLYAVMGPGCETVVRVHTSQADVVVGTWAGGRTGTVLGTRSGKFDYGGIAFGEEQVVSLGSFGGYEPLVEEIARFFQSGRAPVSAEETLEIYVFMEAADESKRQGGLPVRVADVLEKARHEALRLLGDR